MLELLIDKLNLSPEKVREAESTPLCVRLKFVDFPTFEISQAEFATGKKQREKENEKEKVDGLVDFSAGKSCIFTKQPRDLVQAMQSRPLTVGVYKVREITPCSDFGADQPICKTVVPLSGCLCDQVAMAMNDVEHLPKPYTLKNTYNLIDDQETPSGTIAIFMRLSCFGKSIVTHFAFQERSFLFKSSKSSDEFQCTRVPPSPEELARRADEPQDKICAPEGYVEPEENPLPRPQDVIGLAPICQELARRDGGPANLRPPLSAPVQPPKIGMNEPGFDNLTSAEKLNDSDYRGLVYRAHPNEPICKCACSPGGNFLRSSTGDFPCTGAACGGGCCVGTRRMEPLPKDHHGGSEDMPCYTGNCCSGTPRIKENGSICYDGTRMRGGGCCDGNSPTYNPYNTTTRSLPATQSLETLMSGVCGAHKSVESSRTTGCGCQGKSGAGEQAKPAIGMGGGSCTKKPCLGIDCLLRAFKETQEFVDSIGKVPGLAGLGLPDPSESPYFGRERDNPIENSCAPKKPGSSRPPSTASVPFPQKNPHHASGAGRINPGPPPSVAPNPFTVGIAGRTGVVREAIPVLPEVSFGASAARAKKRDDRVREMELNPQPPIDIELGPCGEPRCRSRRRKPHQEEAYDEDQHQPKPTSQVRTGSGGGTHVKVKQNRNQGLPGPAGDRANPTTKSNVRVSKRVMKFVYSAGASYPGVNYGHKNCLDTRMRVPANMGWLWNTNQVVGRLKPRLGWKPGAISRFMNDLFRQAKMAGSKASRPGSSSSKNRKGITLRNKTRSSPSVHKGQGMGMGRKRDEEHEETELPPTLHIHRKDGTYYVTMYPIKQESMEVPQLQEPMKPLQFKITKNKDDADSIASSSTASDMEIEFSPPAAVNRYRKKPNVIHVDTQVKQQEIIDAFKPPGSKKGKADGKGPGKKGKKK